MLNTKIDVDPKGGEVGLIQYLAIEVVHLLGDEEELAILFCWLLILIHYPSKSVG